MSSKKPRDLHAVLVGRLVAAPVSRAFLNLGTFTPNTTVTPASRFIADRRLVVREIWLVTHVVPSDADGTLTFTSKVYDVSEAADDTIVSAWDLESNVTVANRAYKVTLAAETSENELTLDAGDSIRFELINNSAAIDSNPNVSVSIVYQPLKTL